MKEPNRKQNKSFLRLIAPSVFSMVLCAICLVGLTWAWFLDQDTCKVGAIQTSQFSVAVAVSENTNSNGVTENPDGSYTLQSGRQYTVTLTATGSASTGYCVLRVGDGKYVTAQIPPGQSLTVTVDCTYAESDVALTVTPNWMTYSGYSEGATEHIVIGTAPAEPEETQQATESEQTNPAETGETGGLSETPSESPGQSGADAGTEPLPEGGEIPSAEGDAAPAEGTGG